MKKLLLYLFKKVNTVVYYRWGGHVIIVTSGLTLV